MSVADTTETKLPSVADTTETKLPNIIAAPKTRQKVTGSINIPLCDALMEKLIELGTITDGVTYPNAEDEAYQTVIKAWRKHINFRIDTDTQRVKVETYVVEGGVRFAMSLAVRTKRGPRKGKGKGK